MKDTTNKDAAKSVDVLKLFYEYLHHTSWKCGFYNQCSCGLNDLTDAHKLPRVPMRDEDNQR